MKDGFNREITYARISVTDLCNLRCAYCMPGGVEKKKHGDILTIEQLMIISDALAALGVEKQRLTGGEPLVRRGIMPLIRHIGSNAGVKTLAVTTNGLLLKDTAEELKDAGVKAVNISIDTLNAAKYASLTKFGKLTDALSGLCAAKRAGFEKIKLNAVLLRGVNDDEIYTMSKFAKTEGITVRFIELMPFAEQVNYAKSYFISTKDIVKLYDLKYLPEKSKNGKVAFYAFHDGVESGFISPLSDKFCSSCNRVRITADGKLLNCLHESREYDLKPYLGNSEELKAYISECVLKKPESHRITEGCLQSRIMEDIGG